MNGRSAGASRASLPGAARSRAGLDARRSALEILIRVEQQRAFADVLLGHRLPAFAPRDRRLITALVLGTIAWRGRLDYELAHLAARAPGAIEPAPLAILRLGLFQLRFLHRVPAHAAVDTAVALAREGHAARKAAAMINAVLRRAAREVVAMPRRERDEIHYLAVAYSHPQWLVERYLEWFGAERAESVLAADNQPAPTAIRLNRSRGSRDAILARLCADGFKFATRSRLPETAILDGPAGFDTESYRGGLFQMQSEASQLIARLLAPGPAARIADCAAAPGGKSAHLAELAGERALVVALDRNRAGLARVRQLAGRLGHRNIAPLCADLAVAPPLRPLSFDAVLLDAPCTGLGTLREHPEIRWRLERCDLARMAAVQRRMLEQASALVRPGGALVYSVCSMAPAEGREVAGAFLDNHPEFDLDRRPPLQGGIELPLGPSGWLETAPDRDGLDGFFAARFKRR